MSDDSQDQAPVVQMPQQAPPSILGATVSQQSPTVSASSPQEQDANAGFQDRSGGGPSRLMKTLAAIANIGSNALAGIPDTGRPSFVTGLGEGIRATKDAQKSLYSSLAPALGLPGLPPGTDFVPPKLVNMMTNKIHGYALDGTPIQHKDLPEMLSTTQAQRDTIAKNGGSDAQLSTLDSMIGLYKANLKALDDHAAGVKQQTKQAELNAEN